MVVRIALAGLALAVASVCHAQRIERADPAPAMLRPLPAAITGRTLPAPGGGVVRQWPGTYFETAFTGAAAFFRVGPGNVSLRIGVDGGAPVALVKPAPGLYRVTGLSGGAHRLRIDVASESQAGPTMFGGFFAPAGTRPAPLPHRARAIEFIGDSHTVGYGNTSSTRQCTEDQVWATTDTSRGLAALTAARYHADYQVNAISGRGIVRNYNGFAADTLPQAYPFALFDKARLAGDADWRPQVIVIALGTNDFSTPLNPGEKWKDREALRADYEATYIRFVGSLRRQYPHAYIVLWATDFGDGEIRNEVDKVAKSLQRAGDARVGFVPVHDLAFTACNYHPSIADDRKIADAIAAYVDAHPDAWRK
jgi:lysophospholipase L1-like esterase